MISFRNSLAWIRPLLLAVLLVSLLPAVVQADTVIFRNDLRVPVVVQTATVVRGVLRRDQQHLLRHGESTPKIKLDANKIVYIYHGKSNQLLFRQVIKASPRDFHYGIIVDPTNPRLVTVRSLPPPRGPGMPRR
jgi:hypothetical protein